jgi:hypothetical protein
VEGEANLYVYDAVSGKTAFVAMLSSGDESDWERLVARPVQLAGEEGRFLVFPSSQSGLTGEETTTDQLFEYDAQTGELVRISKGEDGYNNNGKEVTSGLELVNNKKGFRTAGNMDSVAGDGETVVFVSSGSLSSGASAALVGCSSVYEFRSEGQIAQGGVHLISDGRDVQPNKGSECGAQFLAMDGEAGNILFATDDPLVAGDVDGVQRDLYDAREGGGFPMAGATPKCGGESCLGVVSAPPLFGAAPSVSQGAEGSPPPGVSAAVVKRKSVVVARAQRLAKALKVCRVRPKRRRVACEVVARRRFGSKVKAGKSTRRGK